jgi:hypothetical protein
MRRIILLLQLSVVSGNAMAEQHAVIGGNGSIYYYDVPTPPPPPFADIFPLRVLIMEDRKPAIINNQLNKSNISVKGFEEHKCQEEQLLFPTLTASADNVGTEEPTYKIDYISSNIGDAKAEITCGKK